VSWRSCISAGIPAAANIIFALRFGLRSHTITPQRDQPFSAIVMPCRAAFGTVPLSTPLTEYVT
jgi:hypothetical protein